MKKFQDKYRIPTARATWWNYGNNGLYFITICTAGRMHYFGKIIDQKKMQLTPVGEMALQCWLDIPYHFPFVKLDVFIVMPDHVHGILEIDKPGMIGNDEMIVDPGTIVETQNFASLPITPENPDMINDNNMIGQTQNFASLPNNPGKPNMIDDGNDDGMIDIDGMIINHGMIVETQNFASLPNDPGQPDMIDDDIIGQTQNFASLRNGQQPPSNHFGPQSQNLASILRGYKIGVKKYAINHQIDFDWQTRYYDHIIRNEEKYNRIRNYIIENPDNWKEDR
jgi:REP element-mobilizing transposase RayT